MSNRLALLLIVFALIPSISQAKGGDEQDQIILLNDSASILEDTDPGLAKLLTQYADEQEKDWENKNANKDAPTGPMTGKKLQDRIKLIKTAALAVGPAYPLIAKSLEKMAKDLDKANGTKK